MSNTCRRNSLFSVSAVALFATGALFGGASVAWGEDAKNAQVRPGVATTASTTVAAPVNTNAAFEVGTDDQPLAPGTGAVVGTPLPGPDWTDLFTSARAWKDVIDEFGQPAASGNGVPDFLDTWGDYRGRRDATFIFDDISAGTHADATAIIASPGLVGVGIVQTKNDLGNAYAYNTYDALGNQILYTGVERLTSTGPSSIVFEFNQSRFSVGGGGVIQGTRAIGDLRARVDLNGAGVISAVTFDAWDLDVADGTFKFMPRLSLTGEGCGGDGKACAASNGLIVQGGAWPSFDASGNPQSDLRSNTFIELGVNVSKMLGVPEVRFTGIQLSTPQDYARGTFVLTLGAVSGGCIEEVSGFNSASCTANDVSLTDIVEGSVIILDDGCTSSSDTVTFTAQGIFELTTNERFDIGLFIQTDGDSAASGDASDAGDGARGGFCTRFDIANAPDPPYVNLDGDVCGDINAAHSPLTQAPASPFGPVTIQCVDNDNDGKVDLIHCETWNQPGANIVCNGAEDIKAGSPSKCNCATLPSFCIAAPDNNPCTRDVCAGTCANNPQAVCEDNGDCPGSFCTNLEPAHLPEPSTVECTGTSNGGLCDAQDHCDGDGQCADNYQPATTICRASAGQCDVAESCTGTTGACPANGFQPATTTCTGTSNGGACDGPDSCSGTANTCVDGFLTATTICRQSTGQCDLAESCSGSSSTCPANGFQPATTACTGTSNGGACDGTDSCDGQGICVDGFRTATTICRPSAGQCDVAESCSGTTGACPADVFQPATTTCTGTSNGGACDGPDSCSGTANTCVDGFLTATTICRASAGQCDVAESCTGQSGACPANVFQPATTTCTGTSNGGACDGPDSCSGTANTCVDGFLTATTICRASAGQCDVAESCTGQSGACPANVFQPATTTCTGTSNGGACDGPDSCSGTANTCVDGFLTATTICRASAGQCDVAESCSGTTGACPADVFQPATTTCTGTSNGGACDGPDSCSGTANTCVDGFLTATTICRASAGQCDVAESCTGQSGACPADVFQPATTTCTGTSNGGACDGPDSCSGTANTCVDGFLTATTICRASAGQCDVAESCTGQSGACPADVFQPATTTCTGTSNGGACDGPDSCSGTANTCVDGFLTATTICRASAGQCDVAESCTGQSGACPADVFQPATTTCTGTSNGGACDGPDSCSGTANTCVDGFLTATTICRASAGQCDVAESCTGQSGACPADVFQPATTTCTGTSNGGACDGPDSCSGTANTCVDGFLTATTICRASAGQCDVAESCTGQSGACPADVFQPATTTCTGTSNGGACDGPDSCSGTANTCVDGFLTATTICRASAGQCDVAESCSGTTGACPANGFQPATTTCTGTSNGGACDGPDSCSGTANTCVDGFLTATTICRASAGQCDVAESCSGTSGACPANGFQPATTPCTGTSNGGACDATDSCNSTGTCVDGFSPTTTICRTAAGQCDLPESCSGTSGACPANAFQPVTTTCTGTSNGGACDATDSCNGTGTCVDGFSPSTTICRASAGQCDLPESCSGTSGACPANAFQPATTTCTGTSNGGPCDGTDSCSGSGQCIDGFRSATTICRPSVGQCDVAESCSGTSGACPANGFQPATTTCTGTSNGGPCDGTDSCDAQGHCVEGYRSATTICRPSTGSCDPAESCIGTSGTCPGDVNNPPPTCSIEGEGHLCAGTTNVYTGPAGANLGYSWAITLGPCVIVGPSNQQSVEVTAPGSGTCTLTLTVTDLNTGCPSTCSTSICVRVGECDAIDECTVPYPFASNNPLTSVVFNESEVLRAFDATTIEGCAAGQIRLFYNDEHALTLGVRRVNVKTGSGTVSTDYLVTPLFSVPDSAVDPQVGSMITNGDQAGTDLAGRPMFPALYITDTTNDPSSLAGDWQYGGTPIPPHAVYGTWKGAVKTVDYTHAPPLVTITPDVDPAKNDWNLDGGDTPPPGLTNQGYGAEVVWDVSRLNLITGHTYRLYFMVHDGDQNKVGGDVGHGCALLATQPICNESAFDTCGGPTCQTSADCNDNNVCNGVETCVGNECHMGTPLSCNDNDVCTSDTCDPGQGCVNTTPPNTTCVCAPDDCPEVGHAGSITSTVDLNGDVTITFVESLGINDNSYGTNAVNWPGGHSFGNLTGSDKAQFVVRDSNGNVVFDFTVDYISAKSGTPSGYASLGATGGDGSIGFGQASWLLAWQTSLAQDLNNTGYCVAGNCTVSGVNLLVNSPPTNPPNTSYNVPAAFSQWNFNITYTVKVSHLAFGAVGFGSVTVPTVHNSPPKCGDNALNTGACACDGTIGNFVWNDLDQDGIQDAGEPGLANVTVVLLDNLNQILTTTTTGAGGAYSFGGLCPGTYSVEVDESTLPFGFVPSPCNVGANNAIDSNCTPAGVALTNATPSDATIDFGYHGSPCEGAGQCSDNNVCNGIETCVGGICQPGTPPNCNDGSTCTVDTCDPIGGCAHTTSASHASIASGFNGTAIPAGRYIWFNANMKASGQGSGLTTINWVNSTISFNVGVQNFTLPVPDGQIIFDPAATCATTSFNVGLQRWETRVPTNPSDEIFISGLSFLVPYNFPGGIKPVTWTGDFTVDHTGVTVEWKWGAAVYTTDMSDYNALGVKPAHSNTCLYNNSDHGGTPENKKSFVVGGARGGGGSNYTGSWSGNQKLKLLCPVSQPTNATVVTNLQFANKTTMSWNTAADATAYDMISGDLATLKSDSGVGSAFCQQDNVAGTQTIEDVIPEPGQCLYYVIRGDAVSPAPGSYDSIGVMPTGQEGRDSELGTTGGADCTHIGG